MATSGTFSFSPALSRLVIAAYSRIGVRRTEIVVEHMKDAEFESNLLLCEWSNQQPLLWVSELDTETLVASTATYSLGAEVVALQMVYISTTDDDGNTTDRPLGPLSTVEYHAIPRKLDEGFPTSYWFDRQKTPQVTLWPVPDDADTYTLKMRVVRQVEDAVMAGGINVEIPYRFNTAFVDGLAARLGAVYPEKAKGALGPNFSQVLEGRAQRSWDIAATQDTESVPIHVTPMMGGYWR
jgi:hypothetical protein